MNLLQCLNCLLILWQLAHCTKLFSRLLCSRRPTTILPLAHDSHHNSVSRIRGVVSASQRGVTKRQQRGGSGVQADCPGDRRNDGCARHKPAQLHSCSASHAQMLDPSSSAVTHWPSSTLRHSLLFDVSDLLKTSDDIKKWKRIHCRLTAVWFSFIVAARHRSFCDLKSDWVSRKAFRMPYKRCIAFKRCLWHSWQLLYFSVDRNLKNPRKKSCISRWSGRHKLGPMWPYFKDFGFALILQL